MKYIFGFLGKFCLYKQPFNLHIYSNNTLIDDLTITEDIDVELKEIQNADFNKFTNYSFSERSQKRWRDVRHNVGVIGDGNILNGNYYPKKLFLYEIDDSILKDRITFQFNNSDTNYTNGFMSKYAWMSMWYTFLIPKSLVDINKLLELGDRFDSVPRTNGLYFKNESRDWTWPGCFGVLEESDGKVKMKQNAQYGGVKKFHIPIIKKHSIHMIGAMPRGDEDLVSYNNQRFRTGRITDGIDFFYKVLFHFNKLNIQNEDKRDNHTQKIR